MLAHSGIDHCCLLNEWIYCEYKQINIPFCTDSAVIDTHKCNSVWKGVIVCH